MDIQIKELVIRITIATPPPRIEAVNAPELRRQLHALLEDGRTNLVVDLSAVSFLDSAGLAVLVSTLKRARQEGGNLHLVAPTSPGAQRIFSLTRLDQVFEMSATVADAVKGF